MVAVQPAVAKRPIPRRVKLGRAARLAGIALLAVQSACGSPAATTAATPSADRAMPSLTRLGMGRFATAG